MKVLILWSKHSLLVCKLSAKTVIQNGDVSLARKPCQTPKTQLIQLQDVEYNFIPVLYSPSPLLQGVLSLANGDCLDGLFSGDWTAGLKVVGTYTKPATDEPENKERNILL